MVISKLHQSLQYSLFAASHPIPLYFKTEEFGNERNKLCEFLRVMDVVVGQMTSQCLPYLACLNPVDCVFMFLKSSGNASDVSAVVRVLSGLIRLESPALTYIQQCTALFDSFLFGSLSQPEEVLQVVSQCFQHLTESLLDECILPVYETWFGLALKGIGSYEEEVRKAGTAVMRLLVPLAPLAKEMQRQVDSDPAFMQSASMVTQLFGGRAETSLESSELDRAIALKVTQCTNLSIECSLTSTDQPPVNQVAKQHLLTATVRKYQWEGVMWLTKLRRCGMGGVLADEM